jgi:UDP-2,3-diacylglucosamine hydrolase
VLWIAGNHDCWGGEVVRQDVGVSYHVGAWEGRIAGWQARVEHGDGLRPIEDRGYRALRAVLRNRLAIRAMKILHPDVGSWVATKMSHTSRDSRAPDGGAGLRAVAEAQLARPSAPELLVFAHSHVATLERGPRRSVYANAGSWLADTTYLRVTPARVELRRWGVSPERECLHALDRGAEEALT